MAASARLLVGDCLELLKELPDESVHCCVTSPPYYGLRNYGVEGQTGLEPTPELYVARLVEVFREVRRVLRKDGTCWGNLGDSYFGTGKGPTHPTGMHAGANGSAYPVAGVYSHPILKRKDLIGIPWRVAFALQADGWYLRSDIIWAKPNPMPESVRDRPTKAHEYIFLLTKSSRYYYDADAIAEDAVGGKTGAAATFQRNGSKRGLSVCPNSPMPTHRPDREVVEYNGPLRNARTVWTIATQAYREAHFAVFPEALSRRCIMAGCPEGGTVLDPFAGSGTTLAVAVSLGRDGLGMELNPEYAELARKRLLGVTPALPLTADKETI